MSFIALINKSIVIRLSHILFFTLSKSMFSESKVFAKSRIDLLASRETSSQIASISAATYQSVSFASS